MRDLATNWKSRPGNYDPLKGTQLFPGVGDWSIPELEPEMYVPEVAVPYDDWGRIKPDDKPRNAAVHFYTDDYRFEAVWNNPERTLHRVDMADVLFTPDFSLYRDHPLAIQLWNTYRNRWVGAFWQSRGLRVIPTVGWSTKESYSFCFDGLPLHGLVSVSSVGIMRDPVAIDLFKAGYDMMLRLIQPRGVVFYGETIPDVDQRCPIYQLKPWHMRLRSLKSQTAARQK